MILRRHDEPDGLCRWEVTQACAGGECTHFGYYRPIVTQRDRDRLAAAIRRGRQQTRDMVRAMADPNYIPDFEFEVEL